MYFFTYNTKFCVHTYIRFIGLSIFLQSQSLSSYGLISDFFMLKLFAFEKRSLSEDMIAPKYIKMKEIHSASQIYKVQDAKL